LQDLNIMDAFRVYVAQTRQHEISKKSVTGKILYTNSSPVRDFCLSKHCFILMDYCAQGCREGSVGNVNL